MFTVKKSFLFIVPLLSILYVSWNHESNRIDPQLPVIAITQIIEHPALDLERQSIIDTLQKNHYVDGKNIKLIYKNAQGNVATATQIATQLVTQKPALMIAISTPSAQAALAACRDHKIPLIFTAVTDPVSSKLTPDATSPVFITGVSDYIPASAQLKIIKQIAPHIKKIGIIYNPGEVNSVSAVKQMHQCLKEEGIELMESTAHKSSDVTQAAQHLVGKVDLIYVPTDNTVVSGMKFISNIALQHKIMVIAADEGSVDMGAFASISYSRRLLGEKAAHLALKILKGVSAQDLPIQTHHDIEIRINAETMNKIGYELSEELKNKVLLVSQKA